MLADCMHETETQRLQAHSGVLANYPTRKIADTSTGQAKISTPLKQACSVKDHRR